jgi:FAD/FMN-containing dehydrogenase
VLARVDELAAEYGFPVANVFHAGDGNLHPNIAYDGSDPVQARRVHAAMSEVMTACIAAGGTVTGEHGLGLDKLPYMERLFTPDTLAAMCALRDVFDPDRRANPGKVTRATGASRCGSSARGSGSTRVVPATPPVRSTLVRCAA